MSASSPERDVEGEGGKRRLAWGSGPKLSAMS